MGSDPIPDSPPYAGRPPRVIRALLRQAMRRKAAAQRFLENAERVAAAGVPALSEDQIQAEIEALRKARPKPRRAARGR